MAETRRVRPAQGDAVMHDAWMPMPGQTWLGAVAAFVSIWIAMMAAMMLPSLAPALWRHGRAWCAAGRRRRLELLALLLTGYLLVWGGIGVGIYPIGATISSLAMTRSSLARAIPILQGVVVLAAGALQFTSWKARHLACWRRAPDPGVPPRLEIAWRLGLRLGLHCVFSSAGPTAALLALGVMDPRAMAIVAAAVTAERLARESARVARLLGGLALGAGLLLMLLGPARPPALHGRGSPASLDRHILTISR